MQGEVQSPTPQWNNPHVSVPGGDWLDEEKHCWRKTWQLQCMPGWIRANSALSLQIRQTAYQVMLWPAVLGTSDAAPETLILDCPIQEGDWETEGQWRAAQATKGLEHTSWQERLKQLSLFSLVKCRLEVTKCGELQRLQSRTLLHNDKWHNKGQWLQVWERLRH